MPHPTQETIPCDLLIAYVGPDPLGGIELRIEYCDPETRTRMGHTTFRLEVGETLELCQHLHVLQDRSRACPAWEIPASKEP